MIMLSNAYKKMNAYKILCLYIVCFPQTFLSCVPIALKTITNENMKLYICKCS